MQVPLSVPPHCRVKTIELEAETDEAFDAAAKIFDLKPLTVGPIANGADSAYSFRYCHGEVEGVDVQLRAPQKKLKITVQDA